MINTYRFLFFSLLQWCAEVFWQEGWIPASSASGVSTYMGQHSTECCLTVASGIWAVVLAPWPIQRFVCPSLVAVVSQTPLRSFAGRCWVPKDLPHAFICVQTSNSLIKRGEEKEECFIPPMLLMSSPSLSNDLPIQHPVCITYQVCLQALEN